MPPKFNGVNIIRETDLIILLILIRLFLCEQNIIWAFVCRHSLLITNALLL